jgi:hypothetical protein
VSNYYPPMPPPPARTPVEVGPRPPALHFVVVLLLVNLGLSILLTVAVLIARHSVVTFELDHRHVVDPDQRVTLRRAYTTSLWTRVLANIIASVVYVFLVRALLRGRRWAYRRVIWLGGIGIVGLLVVQLTPYPIWMRAEQGVQALVLAALVFFVLRPEVRAHFASGLPGRDVRRFNRQ